MLTQEKLTILRDSLPYDSNKRIKRKLHRTSAKVIAEALADPATKRLDVIAAAIEVAQEYKEEIGTVVNNIDRLA